MKTRIFLVLFLVFSLLSFVYAEGDEASTNPMILRNIKEIKSVNPSDVANLGFGVYQVSAQYNLGSYHQGKWLGAENRNLDDKKTGALWVEFSWDRPETDVVLIDGAGNERRIYLPASTPAAGSTYGEYYWIAEDGSSYYASSNHGHGWPDLNHEQALSKEHLARKSLSPEQKNPEVEEPEEPELEKRGNTVRFRGQLVDQMTGEPIYGARLDSAYDFSPDDVITDSNGNFEFIVSADFGGAWAFLDECHGWSSNIGLQKDYEIWENGQLNQKYGFALRKEKFDAKEEVIDVSGKNDVDIGKVYAWPAADISIESDIDASFFVRYKYKNTDGYNGGGNSNFRKEHYLPDALPLDYDVFIQFEDQTGKLYKTSTYRVSSDTKCGVVSLKYINGQSEWSGLSKVEPTEQTGPIKIDVPEVARRIIEKKPEVVSSLCYGCLKETTCYPLGYRKSGEYCSEDKVFAVQFEAELACDNNFECKSNVCVAGKCLSLSLLDRIINWFKSLFG